MRWRELIVEVSSVNNLEALCDITQIPQHKVKQGASIEVEMRDNKVRGWKWRYRPKRSVFAKLLGL